MGYSSMHTTMTWHYSPDTVLTVHASLPPLPLCIAVLYFAIVYSFQLQSGRVEPYGLVPTNLASQAWTSVLAWYTGHPVGGQRHPGTCLSRRAFPTILALQPSLDQRPCLPYWPPGLWLAALAGAITAGGWEMLHRLVGYSCPCQTPTV